MIGNHLGEYISQVGEIAAFRGEPIMRTVFVCDEAVNRYHHNVNKTSH